MPHRIRLLLDSANNLSFATDLTPRLLSLRWRAGMAQPDDPIAAPLEGQALLDAAALDFSGWEGLAVRVLHDDLPLLTASVGAITRTLGRARPQATLHLRDALAELAELPTPALLGPALSGDWVRALLERLPLRRRWLSGRWRLGVPTHGMLGAIRLPPPAPLQVDAGRSRLSDSGGERSLLMTLRAIAGAEGGRFFCDADDQLVFRDRASLLAADTPSFSLSDAFEEVTQAPPDRVTLISVRTMDVRRGAAGSVLWVNPQAVRCAGGETRRVPVRWQGAQGQPIGAADVLEPVRGVDLRLGRSSTTYSAAATFGVGLALVERTSGGATLEVRNPYPYDLYLLPGSLIRGTPLEPLPQPLTIARDDRAIAQHGLCARQLDLPFIAGRVEGLAKFHLRAGGTGWQSVTVDAAKHPSALAVRLWERVALSTSQPPQSVSAFITAQTHAITQRGARHRVTWELYDALDWRYWLLNARALNVDARLAY
ncbi:MAG: hypothetical protein SNJ54_13715 [Anaerolineae bacterium]